ncbi:SHOCT domain-containing protein [Actinoplanes sp. CA-051413]|uniref:SHOCT domain-containing protein n=1 Tax=Actinoplanes sp. CA-051413 TaxID=3239899 RepID=UPI003D9785E2
MMYGNGMSAGWTLMMFAVVLPALLLAVGLIVAQLWRRPAEPPPGTDAEQLLGARFARGEIQTEEYEQRLHTLRAGRR